MSEPSTADVSHGDPDNEDERMTDADDDDDDDEMMAGARRISDILNRSEDFIHDGSQQIQELKDEAKDIRSHLAALEAFNEAQELANAKRDQELKELEKLVYEFRDIMKLQAEKIDTLSEDLAKHLVSPPH